MNSPQLVQARKFAAEVNKLTNSEHAKVWDKDDCIRHAYKAEAGVVMEETGLGAINDTADSGYGHIFNLTGMTRCSKTFAEPYANWLLLFYKRG